MNSREQSDMTPAPSYPSPNAAQMAQGAMPYYSNRQLTADELLSAELSRETSGPALADGSGNGVPHGESMVLGSSNAGASNMERASSGEQHQHQHMLQFPPSQQVGVDPNHDLSYGEQSARKRSKISRACDECRRKKVRCDANTDAGHDQCSNCRRLGAACQFSRVPMKRGPSKGYIKELAERLHTLESQMQPGMVQPDVPYQSMNENEVSLHRGYQDFASPVDSGSATRKRTYSVFDGLSSSSFAQAPFNARGPQSAFDAPESTADPHNPAVASGAAPKPGNLFWNPTGNEQDLPSGLEMDLPRQEGDDDMTPISLDEGALNAYYDKIHTLLPILSHKKKRMLELLHQCNRSVQETFCHALYAVTHTNVTRVASSFVRVMSFEHAQELLLGCTRSPVMVHPTATNLIWLQSLLLMIIDCDTRGPDNLLNRDGIPKHALIQVANKLGYELAKSHGQLKTHRVADPDVESNASLIRRNWTSLIILTRWYAMSMADASVLGSFEIGGPEDSYVMGPIWEGIAAYSSFLVEIVPLATMEENVCQTSTGMGRMVANNVVGALERIGDMHNVSNIYQQPEKPTLLESLQNQLYWTMRLLFKRHVFVYSPYEIIYSAMELINTMHKSTMQNRQSSPFDLHSLALAAMTLLEATVLREYAIECWESLKKVEEILDRRSKRTASASEFDDILGTPTWDAKIRLFLEWRRTKTEQAASIAPNPPVVGPSEQRSLQHLADLAVGAEGSVNLNPPSTPPPALPSTEPGETSPQAQIGAGRVVVDFTLLTKEGYLNVFSGAIFRHSR